MVDADGAVITAATVLPPGSHVYLYRELPDEVVVPYPVLVLHRDENIVVVDKPHFLATMPRGGHVAQTALVGCAGNSSCPSSARRTAWTG